MIVDLFGSFPCTIENGRIKLPAPFCKALSLDSKQKFHVMKENGEKLLMYSQEQWEAKAQDLRSLRVKEGGGDRLFKFADSHYTIDIDKNGRLTIPRNVREAANLEKKVVVVGMFDHMEIWDYETYERKLGRM